MEVYIPYRPVGPKTRLSSALSLEEREEFSQAMLYDVAEAVQVTEHVPRILTTTPIDCPFETIVSTASLSDSINAIIDEYEWTAGERGTGEIQTDDDCTCIGVVMADLALATPAALERLFSPVTDVAIAPGRGGGTNAFVTQTPKFRVDYHGLSYYDHQRIIKNHDLHLTEIDSFRLSTDIDEPDDLIEVLIHGHGRSHAYLNENFNIDMFDEEICITRC